MSFRQNIPNYGNPQMLSNGESEECVVHSDEIWSQRGLSSQNATAAALPTFRESTPWDMGIMTV